MADQFLLAAAGSLIVIMPIPETVSGRSPEDECLILPMQQGLTENGASVMASHVTQLTRSGSNDMPSAEKPVVGFKMSTVSGSIGDKTGQSSKPPQYNRNVMPEIHHDIAASALPIPFKTVFQSWKVPKLHQYSPKDLQVVYHRRSGQTETVSPHPSVSGSDLDAKRDATGTTEQKEEKERLDDGPAKWAKDKEKLERKHAESLKLLEQIIQRYQHEANDYKEVNSLLKSKLTSVSQDRYDQAMENATVHQELIRKHGEIKTLTLDKAMLTKKVSELHQTLCDRLTEIKECINVNIKLRTEVSDMKTLWDSKESALKEKHAATCKILVEKLDVIQSEMCETATAFKKLERQEAEEKNAIMIANEKEKESDKSMISELKLIIAAQNKTIAELEMEKGLLQENQQLLQSNFTDQEILKANVEDQLIATQKQLSDAIQEKEAAIEEQRNIFALFQKAEVRCEKDVKAALATIEESEKVKIEIKNLNDEIEGLIVQAVATKLERDAVSKENVKLKDRVHQLEGELESLQSGMHRLRSAIESPVTSEAGIHIVETDVNAILTRADDMIAKCPGKASVRAFVQGIRMSQYLPTVSDSMNASNGDYIPNDPLHSSTLNN